MPMVAEQLPESGKTAAVPAGQKGSMAWASALATEGQDSQPVLSDVSTSASSDSPDQGELSPTDPAPVAALPPVAEEAVKCTVPKAPTALVAASKGSTCRNGHMLQTAAAMAGNCDGCNKPVKQGQLVMDCRQCNFYLCSECRPITHAPNGDALQRWVCQGGGVCDGCKAMVKPGEMVMDARKIDWFLCQKCCPQDNGELAADSFSGVKDDATPAPLPLPECPNGRKLAPRLAIAGHCDKCKKGVRNGEGVWSDATCSWYMCTTCRPITQCPEGHSLRSVGAIAGKCDLCKKPIATNQNVLDCRRCNWYICAMCFQPRA
jgi:hypothetical protein